jgi:AdoMet-dependent heme synthase
LGSLRNKKSRYLRLLATLFRNAIRFRYFRIKNSPLKPTVLSLAVTNRCNSHCIMCNIWKTAGYMPNIQTHELSHQQIVHLLSNPLFSELVELDLTGGEPHLRNDLVDIALGIARLKMNHLTRLRSIIITSNGFSTEKIISNYRDILAALNGTNIDLVGVISLDGIGDIHDQIRGTKGAFKLVSETIKRLTVLKRVYPNLILGLKTTVIPDNIEAIDNILDFALSNNLFHIISPVLFTETRFRNIDKREKLTLGTADYNKILDFYGRDELKTSYFYSIARSFLAGGKKKWVCAAMYNYAFIDFDGNVYPCELIPDAIGNVKEQDFPDIWNGTKAQNWRKRTGKLERCRTCHEPGTVRYSAITEGASYLKFFLELGKRKYNESLEGEGFSKYFIPFV